MTTKGRIMKKLIGLALVTVGVSLSARAQWIVYDPTMNIQQILDQAESILNPFPGQRQQGISAEQLV